MEKPNPCLTCGACCAFYRASFYWAETDEATFGGVPVHLTEKMNDFRAVMKGSKGENPLCIALQGEVGVQVACSIYERRASVCREFIPAWYDGITPNERCDRARAAFCLPPLHCRSWTDSDPLPRAA